MRACACASVSATRHVCPRQMRRTGLRVEGNIRPARRTVERRRSHRMSTRRMPCVRAQSVPAPSPAPSANAASASARWCRARSRPRPAAAARPRARHPRRRAPACRRPPSARSACSAPGAAVPPAAPRARLQAGGHEQLRRRVGKDHGADVAAVEHGAALGGEVALEVEQRRAHPGDRGHGGRGGVGRRAAQIGRAPDRAAAAPGRPPRRRRVGRIAAGVQHAAADGAVQQAGVEIRQAQRGGEPARERALARRRRGRRWR